MSILQSIPVWAIPLFVIGFVAVIQHVNSEEPEVTEASEDSSSFKGKKRDATDALVDSLAPAPNLPDFGPPPEGPEQMLEAPRHKAVPLAKNLPVLTEVVSLPVNEGAAADPDWQSPSPDELLQLADYQ